MINTELFDDDLITLDALENYQGEEINSFECDFTDIEETMTDKDGMNILSLFDGMACGCIAMLEAGVKIKSYEAYEVDSECKKTVKHNFPFVKERGDVFRADFSKYNDIDFLIGGSPCTYWSIAQSPDRRETTAEGIGWELFSQYVRALNEAKPKYFIYENNKSMAKEIYNSISETFGFEPIMINSALVSAQNRQRYYWVGKRNDDGTYSKVNIEQPKDRGILLKDILDNNEWNAELAMYNSAHGYNEGSVTDDKTSTLTQSSWQENHMLIEPIATDLSSNDKSYTLTARYGGATAWNTLERHQKNMVAEPVCVASRGRNPDNPSDRTAGMPTEQRFEAHADGKTNTLTTVQKDNYVCEPICLNPRTNGVQPSLSNRVYDAEGKGTAVTSGWHTSIAETVNISHRCFNYPHKDGKQTFSKGYRVYDTNGKAVTLCAEGGGMGAKSGLYAIPTKIKDGVPVKAYSFSDTKEHIVYTVKDGKITIKDKTYDIKLSDGYYIIRKLTIKECMRLQTIPEWYDFSCTSNSQAYKMLGNGWTVEVIKHLIDSILAENSKKESDSNESGDCGIFQRIGVS